MYLAWLHRELRILNCRCKVTVHTVTHLTITKYEKWVREVRG